MNKEKPREPVEWVYHPTCTVPKEPEKPELPKCEFCGKDPFKCKCGTWEDLQK